MVDLLDTESFIDEVQKWPCLWDVNDHNYFFRLGRKKAWESIAANFFPSDRVQEQVPELQRKWKHIRDYYVRERRKTGGIVSVQGKRKKTLQKLQFLEPTEERISLKKRWKKLAAGSSPVRRVYKRYHASDDDEASNTATAATGRHKPIKIKVEEVENEHSKNVMTGVEEAMNTDWVTNPHIFHGREAEATNSEDTQENVNYDSENIVHMIQHHQQMVEEDSDRLFLLSLLPQMKRMTEAQNFDFRLDVMRLIKNVRYPHGAPTAVRSPESRGDFRQIPESLPVTVWIKEEVDDLNELNETNL